MRGVRKLLLLTALLLSGSRLAVAQEAAQDSVFRLLQADRAFQNVEYATTYRHVDGNVVFFHNNTYLSCDSAVWNVEGQYIEAFRNVKLVQNNTVLSSDRLMYIIDRNLARFSGEIVELLDRDSNMLRTLQLEYNTKDSVAVFNRGGAMRSRDGNIAESQKGTYDAKTKCFTFETNVQLLMDSIQIKTTTLDYLSAESKAVFNKGTYLWKGDGRLNSNGGWYDRASAVSYFSDNVYIQNADYEAWTDEVYYDQVSGYVDMYSNSQILDTVNTAVYIGNHISYAPDSGVAMMTVLPAIVYYGENENHIVDSIFIGADTLLTYTKPRCSVSEEEIAEAEKRKSDMMYDALKVSRQERAEKLEKERIEKLRKVGKLPPEDVERKMKEKAAADSIAAAKAVADSIAATTSAEDSSEVVKAAAESIEEVRGAVDTESVVSAVDSIAPVPDSSAVMQPAADSTPVRYLVAYHNVKSYRTDIQALCDSLIFCEIDSIARLFGRPVLWNGLKNQLSAETMNLLVKEGNVEKGSMITNAWVISQEDTLHYNQIKSTEMFGFFRDNQVYRYDALGGVNAVFYLAEKESLSTVNIKESKSLTAMIKDGNAQRLLYMEQIKSDAYPLTDIEIEKQRLKDFEWRGAQRPVDRFSITPVVIRPSQRSRFHWPLPPTFPQYNKYFIKFDEMKKEKGTLANFRGIM